MIQATRAKIACRPVLALALAVQMLAIGSGSACEIPADLAALRQEVLDSLNAERRAAGLAGLTLSTRLDRAAQDHACDNADHQSYSHEGSDGSTLKTRLRRVGYGFRTAAENTGRGFGSTAKVVAFWMGSPGHRANILLGRLREVGIGIALSDPPDSKLHWVVDFGRGR